MRFRNVFICIFFGINIISVECAKILSIFTIPSPSHYIFGSALLKELALQGHEITSVNTYPQKKTLNNFRDIYIEKSIKAIEDLIKKGEQEGPSKSTWRDFINFTKSAKLMSENIFEHDEIKALMNSPEGKFDLIIMETLFMDSLYGFSTHFNVPMIGVSTFGTTIGIDDLIGNSSPNSIIPVLSSSFQSRMTFLQRLENFYENLQLFIIYNYVNYGIQKELYHKYFPDINVDYDKATRNFSLILLNQHHSLSYPRPYLPNMIEVGGLHISNKTEPLPKNLQDFIDNAADGVIYFSLGSNVKSENLPKEKREILLNVFRNLKQKVIWKFESSQLPNKPDNVLISQWLPQQSILAHPNVKLFITHGGLLSTTEAIFFGKPILGIPVLGDQPRNIAYAVKRGIALSINFKTFTEDDLKHAVNELLYNPQYAEKIADISSHYHDQPMTPMQTAIYWIEYVLRHKGAEHLRCAALDLNFWQYYSIDVIGTYLVGLLFVILFVIWILCTLYKFIAKTFKSPPKKANKKVKRH